MYHRHSTSSTGSTGSGAPPQHHQQAYPFQRARSMGSRPTSQMNSSYDNNVSNNGSYSSFPDTDDNYYGKSNNSNNAHYRSGQADSDCKYSKRNNNSYVNMPAFIVWRVVPCLILMLLPWIPNQFVRSQVKSKRIEIETIIQEQKELVKNLDATTSKINDLKEEVEILNKDNELSFQELRRNGKTPGNLAAGEEDSGAGVGGGTADMESEGYQKIEGEEDILIKRIDKLEKSIQKSAVKRLSKRYGNGQYRFKVNVRDQQSALRSFVIETAMLAEMPHAIDHFFRMIEKKLWNGLALVHEPHSFVVSATPMMTDENHAWAGQRFVDANITHMAFTEHSPTYPPPHHRLYTVAFSGRPGGPGFYISLDNELDYAREQESTFGVVMEGRDVLYQFFLQRDVGRKKILTIESIDILETKMLKEEDP
mmetsp:Transcript_2433/g.6525  ORF Transcript_2433/g.6525 Transcript_2433/m.6525 type:complete len:423 (+) Transcript_2433:211-1479(+)|eukprot:CAMPEP_0172375542 /NCGR_PEP_ID=MMETSP1060-20121228/62204_1 /TAXON_ID=37318 /ORGANISM="Pseudo-nitzschia pungens, Strain cf. cingulata" /LENGTH=422 /DNA_ID=CAMNT_0013102707 /DNA_START=175 /DNA_END=1443 /DNA_ORIENTATION=-